ncbi:hypothetical protein DN752_17160 [Echinicola strongylocentroti]|uniref:PorV/PorQ family protein n=1 Tax=Echinicola strongylocentroti TaxID=1795355 RepID=A0A2Z4IMA1_9BACT|nr:hypothetical protein [Echinicola strongylocentroti]AWW31718.1 hypothetical protein DN752_17160 [Echinicola strongylocentroti]
MKFILKAFSYLILIAPYYSYGQNGSEVFAKGARSYGLANTHVTLTDAWSIFNNPGAMGRLKTTSFLIGYDHRLGLNELTTLGAGAVIASDKGNFGVSLSHFGGALFNQQAVGIGYANQLGIASFGVKASYLQTNIEGYGRGGVPVFEFGGTAILGPHLVFGAHVYNFTRSQYSSNSEDYLPTIIKAGLSYQPSSKLLLNLEAEKDILLSPIAKLGLEYNFMEKLWARCGIRTNPSNLHFGIGFQPERFQINYAVAQNNRLGYTHHFSMTYKLK